jgi:hypothetical protein
MKKTFILSFLLLLNVLSFAQDLEAGLFLGGTSYKGDIDIKAKTMLPQARMAVGVFARYPFSSSFAVKAQLTHGQIFGDEKNYGVSDYRTKRGFSFKTQLTELNAQFEWHFLKLDKSFYLEDSDPAISLYVSGGAGLTFFDPKVNFNEPNPIIDDVSLDKYTTFRKITPVIPLSLGSKVRVADGLSIGLEGGLRVPFTDYIDGISRLIASKYRDYYFFAGVNIAYQFNGGGGYSGGNWQKNGR